MRIALLPLAFSLALGACALGPVRGEHPTLLAATALGLAAAPASPAVPDQWWRSFGDEQLDALLERAGRSNPSLAQVLARLEYARAEQGVSAGALAPRVDASAQAVRERYSARYVIPPPYGGSTFWDSQLQLGLSWDLDFWGRQRDLVHAGEDRVQAAVFDAAAAKLAIEAALVTAYLEFDRNAALVEVAAQLQANRAQAAELTRRRVDAGIDAHGELEAAAAPVPEARIEVQKSQARVELLRHQLAALTGQGPEAYAGIVIPKPHLDLAVALPVPEELSGDLLRRRPDLQAALARVRAADAGAEAARLARYPDIRLTAFAGTAALRLQDLLSAPARTLGVGPELLLPVFDAGQLRYRHQAAVAELDTAIAFYNDAVLNAVREAGDQLSLLHALAIEHRDAQRQYDHLDAAYRIARERRQAGISAQQSVLDAEAHLLAARANLISTQTLEAESRVGLLVALGGSDSASVIPPTSAKAITRD